MKLFALLTFLLSLALGQQQACECECCNTALDPPCGLAGAYVADSCTLCSNASCAVNFPDLCQQFTMVETCVPAEVGSDWSGDWLLDSCSACLTDPKGHPIGDCIPCCDASFCDCIYGIVHIDDTKNQLKLNATLTTSGTVSSSGVKTGNAGITATTTLTDVYDLVKSGEHLSFMDRYSVTCNVMATRLQDYVDTWISTAQSAWDPTITLPGASLDATFMVPTPPPNPIQAPLGYLFYWVGLSNLFHSTTSFNPPSTPCGGSSFQTPLLFKSILAFNYSSDSSSSSSSQCLNAWCIFSLSIWDNIWGNLTSSTSNWAIGKIYRVEVGDIIHSTISNSNKDNSVYEIFTSVDSKGISSYLNYTSPSKNLPTICNAIVANEYESRVNISQWIGCGSFSMDIVKFNVKGGAPSSNSSGIDLPANKWRPYLCESSTCYSNATCHCSLMTCPPQISIYNDSDLFQIGIYNGV